MLQAKHIINNKILIYIFSLNFGCSFVNYLNFQCVVNLYILSVIRPFKTNKPLKLKWNYNWNYSGLISPRKFSLTNLRILKKKGQLGLIKRWYNFLKLKKKLRLNYFKFYNLHHRNRKPTFSNFTINQRIFLSKKIMKKSLWDFFYKSGKTIKQDYKNLINSRQLTFPHFLTNSTRNITFLNANKPLLWKMRKARYAHWDLRVRGKLNEWRYHKFLGTELHVLACKDTNLYLNIILLRTYTCILSWRQMILLIKHNLILCNGAPFKSTHSLVRGDIVELPIFIKPRNDKDDLNYFNKIIKRSKRLAYKSFLAFKNKFIRKHEKVPKIFKKLPVGSKFLGSSIAWDRNISAFGVIYDFNAFKHDHEVNITYSSVLTLQNWRYRFD